jgi:polyisoprenoid-binding protein YceI
MRGSALRERSALATAKREEKEMSVIEKTAEQALATGAWLVDPVHSTVEFRVKHMVIATVHGRFREFVGGIVADSLPAVSASIDVASLETFSNERDAHLRSEDFFDVERYPEIVFQSRDGLRFNGRPGLFALPGDLTIKGITRTVELAGRVVGTGLDTDGRERIGLVMDAEIDRTDYGLVWNRRLETGGVLVGNRVELALDLAAVRVD